VTDKVVDAKLNNVKWSAQLVVDVTDERLLYILLSMNLHNLVLLITDEVCCCLGQYESDHTHDFHYDETVGILFIPKHSDGKPNFVVPKVTNGKQ